LTEIIKNVICKKALYIFSPQKGATMRLATRIIIEEAIYNFLYSVIFSVFLWLTLFSLKTYDCEDFWDLKKTACACVILYVLLYFYLLYCKCKKIFRRREKLKTISCFWSSAALVAPILIFWFFFFA